MTNIQTNNARKACFKIVDTVPSLGSLRTENPANWDHKKVRSTPGPTFSSPIQRAKGSGSSSNAGAIGQLEQIGRVSHYPARTAVFQHGDPANSIYLVREGKLKLSLSSRRGRCVVFRFAVAEDLLGLSAVLNQTDHEFLAQTLEPSILVAIPRSEFVEMLHTSGEVNSFATRALARDHEGVLRGIRRLGLPDSVRERLAQLLLNCLEFPRRDCLPMSIRMNWTFGELAEMVNSSRETVNRIMRQFEREELIALRGSLVVIRNHAKLKLLAG
jgi:CRP/FNR family transcriptional regulator